MSPKILIRYFSVMLIVALTVACNKPGGQTTQIVDVKTSTPAKTSASAAVFSGDVANGQKLYQKTCLGCHSIGQGKRIGPDLKDIHKLREKSWLVKWMKDPIGMSKNDPIGKKILAEYNNIPMTNPNLSEKEIMDVMAYVESESAKGTVAKVEKFVPLTGKDFDEAKQIYFDRCAGCHGTLRTGATGPNIEPKRSKQIGTEAIESILHNGLPGGMPPWGEMGILSKKEINLMARYIQMDPPEPPQLPLAKIKESWDLIAPLKDRPTKPMNPDWEDYFGVILRDAGKVAVINGRTKESEAVIDTGFAVHILRTSSTGRYFYAVGRDGKVSMIDLWYKKPKLVSQVQGCYDARSVDSSKYKGYEDKLLIEGCYWPPQFVVFDGQTLEPKYTSSVLQPAYDSKEPLKEVRVAAIVASHFDPVWVVNLKESGHIALVDYANDFKVKLIPSERFLHDGGFDKTKRYVMMAANMRNTMAVVDVKEQKFVTKFETGNKPHPGRGANWKDPQFGWVNATTHIGEGKMTVYGADPKNSPKYAWKVVREIKLDSPGGLFIKTHDNSPWVWFDSPLSNKEELTRQICVLSKNDAKVHKCWSAGDHGRAVHFEYNKAGTEVWVSIWDKEGEIVVYDDKSLKEIKRIKADWLVTPTGKFNVYNTAHDVY